MSLAHRGILFLDECAEMGPKVLDSLRQPLEEGEVRISRRDGVAAYPARFQLLLAAIHCPTRLSKAHSVTLYASRWLMASSIRRLREVLLEHDRRCEAL